MRYVHNRWYDISCATLYDISCATLYDISCATLYIYSLFVFEHKFVESPSRKKVTEHKMCSLISSINFV